MEQLGDKMRPRITLATVAKLETGQMGVRLDYLLEIARVLGCAPADLISHDQSEPASLPTNGSTLSDKDGAKLSLSVRLGHEIRISGIPFDLSLAEARRVSRLLLAFAGSSASS